MGPVKAFYLRGDGLPQSWVYEFAMLAREFYPQAAITDDPQKAEAVFYYGQGRWCGESGGKRISQECPDSASLGGIASNPDKNRLKAGLYCLLEKCTGQTIPWGILTGVRPAKLAFEAMENGRSPQEIQNMLERGFFLRPDKAALTVQVADAERKLLSGHSPSDVSVYVGIPFCPSRCLYCSFVSYDFHTMGDTMERYCVALEKEIGSCGDFIRGRKLQSFYMGGGTPTSLTPRQLEKILKVAGKVFGFDNFREATVEAGRPDTITRERLEVLRSFGIGRISVNPQTMNDKTLERIGRKHSAQDTYQAFELARTMGFENINMDFIVGLPGEGAGEVRYSMEKVKELCPDSITVHTLAVKRSSRLNEEGLAESVLGRPETEEMLQISQQAALEMGMKPYYLYRQKNMAGNFENVGYSLPGKECIYNIEIMEEKQNILAAGAGAVSKVYFPEDNRLERVANVKNVEEYIRRTEEMLERKKRRFIL